MKRLQGFIIGVVFTLVCLSVTVFASDFMFNIINIKVNGVEVAKIGDNFTLANDTEVPFSISYKGTTYLPMRKLAELLNKEVSWDGATTTAGINDKVVDAFDVVRVIDGDTFIVNYFGKEERVRLIGVDTPETVHPTKGEEPFGKEASDYTKSQLEGKSVRLEFDVQERDMYGRLLAYAWVDGKMLNKTLLEKGYAMVSTFPPNVKHVDDFVQLQRQAITNNIGLWSDEYYQDKIIPDKVNINTATIEELKHIIHINDVRAEELIRLRPFSSLDDLSRISGIGSARVEDIKEQGMAIVE